MLNFDDFVQVLYPSAIQSLGWLLICYCLISSYKRNKLRQTGEKCIAIVKDKRVQHGSGKDSVDTYYMTIEFVTNDSKMTKSESNRLHILNETSTSGEVFAKIETGQFLEILYDINDPLNYCIDDKSMHVQYIVTNFVGIFVVH